MRTFLEKITKEAGAIALGYWQNDLPEAEAKGGNRKDVVTEVDRTVEHFLRQAISTRYPDHGFLGEEEGCSGSRTERWLIDPIDGTASFAHGQHFFSISIAFERNGQPELGAVYAPALNDFYIAERGSGAWRNDKSIRVSQRERFDECIFATGFACLRAGWKENNLPILNAVAPLLQGFRRCGSAALDLACVACGQYDAFWEMGLMPYDIAAGRLLVQEAGGMVTDFEGGDANVPTQLVASNGLVHDRLLAIIDQTLHDQHQTAPRPPISN